MISKSLIEKKFKVFLKDLGYIILRDTTTVAEGLFFKIIEESLVLEVGFTISKIKTAITFFFYLSPTFQFGLMLSDYPKNNYKRGASFLTSDERLRLLPKDYHGENIVDGWWHDLSDETVSKIIEVIKIAEPRFLSQSNLIPSLKNSNIAKERIYEYYSILEKFKSLDFHDVTLIFSDCSNLNNMPESWLKCTESHFMEKRDHVKVNKNIIKSFAVESWRYLCLHPMALKYS